MKIVLQKGCTGERLEIDGKLPAEEEISAAVMKIIQTEVGLYKSWHTVLTMLLERYGDYEIDKTPCDQCGNWGETITIEL